MGVMDLHRQSGKEAPGMKRRSLFLFPLLAFPAWLFGQSPDPGPGGVPGPRLPSRTAKGRRASDDDDRSTTSTPKRSRKLDEDTDPAEVDDGPPAPSAESVPANFPNQTGFQMQTISIADYTALDPNSPTPLQTAIIDWIFRRTTPAPWHGEKLAALCASKTQLRSYNTTKINKQVAEVVKQFTQAYANILSVRVRFIAAADARWRYVVHQRLTPVGSGPQGQQIWYTSNSDAEQVYAQMQIWQGFKLLGDTSVEVINGQTLKFSKLVDRAFTGGIAREGAVGLGFQPKVEKLEEGVVLRFSPLLSYDGDTLDAAIELSTNLLRKVHPVKVMAPQEVGPKEISLDVPEVSETRLNQTVKGWPLGQTLIISAGIQPGILLDKGGLFNMRIPGTVPTETELLVIINIDLVKEKKAR
jgi:hypothetical protein